METAVSTLVSTPIAGVLRELDDAFSSSADKHEAHRRSAPILAQASRDPGFLTAVLERYLLTPGALDRGNYPVVGIDIALNEYYGLVANCWIPLPSKETHISTKAIHHHGDMLLSTATIFGPGYEHWMFTTPQEVDSDTYSMRLIEARPHPMHHVAFVDAWIAHTPLYPKDLSITLALWSSRFPVTWKDRVKRMWPLRGREDSLRRLAVRLGLRRTLDLKVVENFDYFPKDRGFRVMRVRKEFELGPNEDHVCSVFHVVQKTGNEHLADAVKRALRERRIGAARGTVERLLSAMEEGREVQGRLSRGHFGLDYANFTRDQILAALRVTSES